MTVVPAGPESKKLILTYYPAPPPVLESSSIRDGAWFHYGFRPQEIRLLFNVPIDVQSITNSTFKLVTPVSTVSINTAAVDVSGREVVVSFDLSAYTGQIVLTAVGLASQDGIAASRAISIGFTIGSESGSPIPQAPLNTSFKPEKAGRLRISKIVSSPGQTSNMVETFRRYHNIEENRVLRMVQVGSELSGQTETYILWYDRTGPTVVSIAPSQPLVGNDVDFNYILLTFDEPVSDLTTAEAVLTGPGAVSYGVAQISSDATQWSLTGDFSDPGQYSLSLRGVRNRDGDNLETIEYFGWQVMPLELTGSSGGVTDHGALTGLGDDDHTQYHNDARGDARYTPLAHVGAGGAAHSIATTSVAGFLSATDKTKLDALDAGTQAELDAHILDTIDAHDASAISFDPAGLSVLTGNNVQSALTELDANSQTYIKKDGTRTFTANQSMGTHRLTDVVDPVQPQDAATKNYVDTGQLTAGDGLSVTGTTLKVNVDNSTIEINADIVRVKDSGITESKIGLTDVTTLNANTSRHGFAPKVTGVTGDFLSAIDGTYRTAGGRLLNTVVYTTGSGTYNPSTGCNTILVYVTGGGGGGGGCTGTAGQAAAAGGGGGGGTAVHVLAASSYSYAVGGGGTAGTTGGGNGGAGTASTFGSVTGNGGGGGTGMTATAAASYAAGGAGGTSSGDSYGIPGENGGVGIRQTAALQISGAGGNSYMGLGGVSLVNSAATGTAGGNYGGGGAGAVTVGATPNAGGAGAGGKIVIYEYS
jgi:hypothetical protein